RSMQDSPNTYSQTVDLVSELLDRPIAFHRCFATLTDSVEAALFLSQAIYWQKITHKAGNQDFFKTQDEWEEETGLGRYAQERARRILKSLKILDETRRGSP